MAMKFEHELFPSITLFLITVLYSPMYENCTSRQLFIYGRQLCIQVRFEFLLPPTIYPLPSVFDLDPATWFRKRS